MFILHKYLLAGAGAANSAGARTAGSRGGAAALTSGHRTGAFVGSGSALASSGHFYIY